MRFGNRSVSEMVSEKAPTFFSGQIVTLLLNLFIYIYPFHNTNKLNVTTNLRIVLCVYVRVCARARVWVCGG